MDRVVELFDCAPIEQKKDTGDWQNPFFKQMAKPAEIALGTIAICLEKKNQFRPVP